MKALKNSYNSMNYHKNNTFIKYLKNNIKKKEILLEKLGPHPFQFVSDHWQPAPMSHLLFDPISIFLISTSQSLLLLHHIESILPGAMNPCN